MIGYRTLHSKRNDSERQCQPHWYVRMMKSRVYSHLIVDLIIIGTKSKPSSVFS